MGITTYYFSYACLLHIFVFLPKLGPAKAGPFLARATCDPTIVRWRKAMISLGDEQQASDSRLMLSSLDVETLGPLEKFVGMGRDFVDANRDLFLRVGRTSILAR